jgi:hypothetical protein
MPNSILEESEKKQWVTLFGNYDLSAAAFCREFDLPYASFMAWKRLYHGKAAQAANVPEQKPEFVELLVEPAHPATRHDASLPVQVAELCLGAGVVLRIFTPAKL